MYFTIWRILEVKHEFRNTILCGNVKRMLLGQKCEPQYHWGTYLWGFIHTITAIYSEDVSMTNVHRNTIGHLKAIYNVIPCPSCKDTYQRYLDKLQFVDLRQPLVLFHWSVDLHNEVNTKLSKQTMSYDVAKRRWCK